jgi:hypothetical protein
MFYRRKLPPSLCIDNASAVDLERRPKPRTRLQTSAYERLPPPKATGANAENMQDSSAGRVFLRFDIRP